MTTQPPILGNPLKPPDVLLEVTTGHYYALIGVQMKHDGRMEATRFILGTRRKEAWDKARAIWNIWQTQDGLWTKAGLHKALAAMKAIKKPKWQQVAKDEAERKAK